MKDDDFFFIDDDDNDNDNDYPGFTIINDNEENNGNENNKGDKKIKYSSKAGFKDKISGFLKRSKSKDNKNSGNKDFINIGDNDTPMVSDFTIIEKETSVMSVIINFMKISIFAIAIISATVISYFVISFKFIPENIKGSNYRIGDYSVISRDYRPNLDEIRKGDTLIYFDNLKEGVFPVVSGYDKITVKERKGHLIFGQNAKGGNEKVQSIHVRYIISNSEPNVNGDLDGN